MAKDKAKSKATDTNQHHSIFFDGVQQDQIRGQVERWSHDDAEVGDSLLGTLISDKPIKFKDGKEGRALLFGPAVTLTDGVLEAHPRIETILSAVLAQKIVPETDKGTTFAIEYQGTERSEHKGRAPFKKFLVAEISPETLRKCLKDAGAEELAANLASRAE